MAALNDKRQSEAEAIEKLAEEAELTLDMVDKKKDLKERRGITKERFFSGPYKMKHLIPKGKHM